MVKNVFVLLKGIITGGAMLVPGISGASTAIILGIYDELLEAVGHFSRNKRNNIRFLLTFSAGALIGIVLLARAVSGIIEAFPKPAMYFFSGAAAGSIPMIYRSSRLTGRNYSWMIYAALGAAFILFISRMPSFQENAADGAGFMKYLYLPAAGFVLSAALILPGISVSYMLLVMGLYEKTAASAGSFDLSFLVPLSIGLIAGIMLTARLLSRVMTRYPQITYPIILGFMLGALIDVFPGIPEISELFVCVITAGAGFAVVYYLSGRCSESR